MPTPHAGYLKFFRAHAGGVLYVLGKDLIQQFPSLVRNLPGVTPEESKRMIQALGIFSRVCVLTSENLNVIQSSDVTMPDEDVSRSLAERYFARGRVSFDASWRLRWDWKSLTVSHRPEGERVVSFDELDRNLMRLAFGHADRSPDWWRQVGALLVKERNILLAAFNRHVPSEQSAYHYGDPRSSFEAGQRIDVSGALHAEIGIIAEAARRGISMEGCDLYVTTFPCPPCAYACACTGIRRLYYADGYSLIAGAETLEANGVEIVHVEM
ncbi:MAG: deoxycytidylate deaminase [Minisyncoccota bacterium]